MILKYLIKDARYLSHMEATYRLFAIPLHEKSHTIVRLAIHEENRHAVVFNQNNIENTLNNAEHRSMLLQWFELNRRYPAARELHYTQIPNYYVWNGKTWTPRNNAPNEKIISRIYSISPRQVELFHLRLILHHVVGKNILKI